MDPQDPMPLASLDPLNELWMIGQPSGRSSHGWLDEFGVYFLIDRTEPVKKIRESHGIRAMN